MVSGRRRPAGRRFSCSGFAWTCRESRGLPCSPGVQTPAPGRCEMARCLFCQIIARERPASFVYEDDRLVAINDINPQAPLHVLVIPRRHIPTLNDLAAEDAGLVGDLVRRAAAIAKEKGYAERGYRTLLNCNREAGQSVYHIHLHLLAGRRLGWPPG